MNDVQFKLFTNDIVNTYCKHCKNHSCSLLKILNRNNNSLKIERGLVIIYEDGTYITQFSVNEDILKGKKCPLYKKEDTKSQLPLDKSRGLSSDTQRKS